MNPALRARYEGLLATPSDIRAHLPMLRRLASRANGVVEMGVRGGISTTALLAGQPTSLFLVDRANCQGVFDLLQGMAGPTAMLCAWRDSRLFRLCAPVDGLFIDTRHNEETLAYELLRHTPCVRRWVALHDTNTFGLRGEGGGRGLRFALTHFLRRAPWRVAYHSPADHGFTVLRRRGPFNWAYQLELSMLRTRRALGKHGLS